MDLPPASLCRAKSRTGSAQTGSHISPVMPGWRKLAPSSRKKIACPSGARLQELSCAKRSYSVRAALELLPRQLENRVPAQIAERASIAASRAGQFAHFRVLTPIRSKLNTCGTILGGIESVIAFV